jgi:hypothetical protein
MRAGTIVRMKIVSHDIVGGSGASLEHNFGFIAEGDDCSNCPLKQVISLRTAQFLLSDLLGPSPFVSMLSAICETDASAYHLLIGREFPA